MYTKRGVLDSFYAKRGFIFLGIKFSHPSLLGIKMLRTWVKWIPGYYLFLGMLILFLHTKHRNIHFPFSIPKNAFFISETNVP